MFLGFGSASALSAQARSPAPTVRRRPVGVRPEVLHLDLPAAHASAVGRRTCCQELRVGLQSRVQRIGHPFRAAVSCVRYRRSFFNCYFFLFCFGTQSTESIRKLKIVRAGAEDGVVRQAESTPPTDQPVNARAL